MEATGTLADEQLPPRVRPAGPAHHGAGNNRGGGPPRRGRVFERHSGTGRGKEIKKRGAGSHNWGNAEQVNDLPEETREGSMDRAAAAPEDHPEDGNNNTTQQPQQDASPKVVDYAAWEREQKKKREAAMADLGSPQTTRDVGVEELEREGYKLLLKGRDSSDHQLDSDGDNRQQVVPSNNNTTNNNISAAAHMGGKHRIDLNALGGSRRGGRGGNRGGSSSGGSRSNNNKRAPAEKPNVADAKDFPSLG